jgi:(p)ppGpp synthase/HD superfamily hydrolase
MGALIFKSFASEDTMDDDKRKIQEIIDELTSAYASGSGKFSAPRKQPSVADYVPPDTAQKLKDHLSFLNSKYKPMITEILDDIIHGAGGSAKIKAELCSVSVISYDALVEEMTKEDKTLGDILDTIVVRVAVETLMDVSGVMRFVEDTYRSDILQVENYFATNDEGSPYRAVHYLIKVDDETLYELRILTGAEMIISEIYEAVVVKDVYGMDSEMKEYITGLYWGLQRKQLEEYMSAQGY